MVVDLQENPAKTGIEVVFGFPLVFTHQRTTKGILIGALILIPKKD